MLLPQLSSLWLGQPLLKLYDGHNWPWDPTIPSLVELSVVDPRREFSTDWLGAMPVGSVLTSLQAIGKGASAMCPLWGPHTKTLRRLDITVQAGKLDSCLQVAQQLSELRLRGAWPTAADIEVLSCMRRLRVLDMEHAPGDSPALAANTMKQLLRRLPYAEVTCLAPDSASEYSDASSEDGAEEQEEQEGNFEFDVSSSDED